MKLISRIQEWLADRLPFVQYPNLRRIQDKPEFEGRKLSIPEIILLLIFAFFAGIIGLIAIAVGLFILYVIFTSIF